jgi:hypothetical protein
MNIPYNTGKVKIGSRYVPPKHNYMDEDSELIQSAMLGLWARERRFQVKLWAYFILLIAGISILMASK